jgi:hypothetical protein
VVAFGKDYVYVAEYIEEMKRRRLEESIADVSRVWNLNN